MNLKFAGRLLAALIFPLFAGAQFEGDFGDARIKVEKDGSFFVFSKGECLISGATVVVAAPGWKQTVGQNRLVEVAPDSGLQKDGSFLLRGLMKHEENLGTWTFSQEVRMEGEGIRLRYTIVPQTDVVISEAVLFVNFTGTPWRGKPILMYPSKKGEFSAYNKNKWHFINGYATSIILGEKESGLLSFDFASPVNATMQHRGKPEAPSYQLYPRLHTGGRVKAGTACTLDFLLRRNVRKELALPEITLNSRGTPKVAVSATNSERVGQFKKFEVTAEVGGTWDNPYDQDQVALEGEFTAPSGKTLTMPGFFYQDFRVSTVGSGELYLPSSDCSWRVRFAPAEPGIYRYRLRLKNAGKVVYSGEQSFVCERSPDARGYLRVSRENPHYLQFDDGTPFFAVGENIATLGEFGLSTGKELYSNFAAAGGNLLRSWWCSGMTDIESRVSGWSGEGLGNYKQRNLWCIDQLVEHAEQLDLHIMCCFETQQYLRRDKWWESFTYNVVNGGPVAEQRDYFVNREAARHFRNRLRYIVARWSYSTSIFSWQFWNEVSACNNFHCGNAAKWHREMGAYLKGIDPMKHLVHTNHGNLDGYAEIDGAPETELISSNSYSSRDMGHAAIWGTRIMGQRYAKPYLLTEYGVGHHGGWDAEDPEGIILHNGLWGSLVSGAAGTAMPWGWRNWVDALDFYHYWKPVTRVVADVPFCKRRWQSVEVKSFRFKDPALQKSYCSGVFFEGWPRNFNYTFDKTPLEVIRLDSTGQPLEQGRMRGRLWGGESHKLEVDCPEAGEFIVHVPEISHHKGAVLQVRINGETVLTEALDAGKRYPWRFWESYRVKVKGGKQLIEVKNSGKNGLWTAYELTKYRRREGPALDVHGMFCKDTVLLWVRNPQFIWCYIREGRNPTPQPPGSLTLRSIPAGTYAVTWIETTTNETLAESEVEVGETGDAVLATPGITRSAAVKMTRK